MNESNNKTVYFLGAGASHASEFNLPCMEGFFREDELKQGGYPNLWKFIKRKFPGIHFNKLNLEEVITFLELELDGFGSFGQLPEVYMLQVRREFDDYVEKKLHTDFRACREHKKIFSMEIAGSNSQDSIITLNYDLVVDHTLLELWRQGKRCESSLLHRMQNIVGRTQVFDGDIPTIYHGCSELGHYLKLHGSVDWLYCSNNTCGNHQLFFGGFRNESSPDIPGDLCNLCGSTLVRAIVPPTMHKTFEKFPKLGLIWSLAYRKLNMADKIVIFGVSLAPSDYYLRWLFKKALSERTNKPLIVDIDVKDSVCERIENITGIKPVYKRSLDEFLEYEKDNCRQSK